MAKKELGLDRDGIQKVMRAGDYFGDAAGQFALNLGVTLVGQITYFYTDKVGLAAGAVATLLLLSKIIDAFTDLIMGNIVDHTAPGKQKYRPWFLKAGIPMGIATVLLFLVPKGEGWLPILYALATNVLLTAVFYTAVAIPYGSLMAVRTNSQEERGFMGTCRAALGYIAGFIQAILIIPITNALGGDQAAWIKYSVIIGAIIILAMVVAFVTSRESATEAGAEDLPAADEEKIPFRQAIEKLFHNRYWVIVLVVNLLCNIMYGITAGAGTFYCKWIFGNDNLVAVLGGVGLIPTFLGFGLLTPMIKKFGIVKTLKISLIIGIIGEGLLLVFRNQFIGYMIFGCMGSFALIPVMALGGVLTTMAIDYNEYKYGVKMVATSNSASSFGAKVGGGIGGSVIGWTLAVVGYNSKLAVAPLATKMAIYGFSIVIPLLALIVMFVLLSRFDLEEKLPQMRQEIADRREKGCINSFEQA